MDIISGTLVLGGALALGLVTVGPFYLLFETFPKMAQEARKQRFLELRREKRKERTRARNAQKRAEVQGAVT